MPDLLILRLPQEAHRRCVARGSQRGNRPGRDRPGPDALQRCCQAGGKNDWLGDWIVPG
jgi:hypothetical protein